MSNSSAVSTQAAARPMKRRQQAGPWPTQFRFNKRSRDRFPPDQCRHSRQCVAVLQFLAVAELVESDLGDNIAELATNTRLP